MATPNPREQNPERLPSEAIAERRATPSFDSSPIPDKVTSAIVRAGIEAPSGFNLQPWRFIVVRDAEQKRRCAKPQWARPRLKRPERSLSAAAI
jgi:nitroreductase